MLSLRSLFDTWTKTSAANDPGLPTQDIQKLIDAVDELSPKLPAPDLKFATLAHWASESDFGRSELAKQHRNFANLLWDEGGGGHQQCLALGASKVMSSLKGGGEKAYYAFPTMEAFVRGYWMTLLLGHGTQNWMAYKADEAGFIKFIGDAWHRGEAGWADAVVKLLARIRSELGQPVAGSSGAKPNAATAAGPLTGVRTWGYQLQDVDMDKVVNSPFDLMVVDYLKAPNTPYTADDVRRMQSKSGGGRRRIVSYLSIGEAESYRYYWKPEWVQAKPAWLLKENPEWKGNYAVCFWDAGWQGTFCGNPAAYLDQIISAGFDGVYLDKCDVFEDLLSTNQTTGKQRAELERQMVLFVGKLSNYAKTRNPNFAIIMQNAEVLLKYEALREVIDGVAKESLLYGGDGPEKPNSAADVATTKQALDLAKGAGRTVFVVEYLNDPAKVGEATTKLASFGFLSTFSDRSRSLASINRFPVTIGEELAPLPDPVNQPRDGVLFSHSPAPYLVPQGLLVKILQTALKQQNVFAGTISSKYDGPTVEAIKKYQQSKGRTADGICRNGDWEDITGMPAPSIFDRCLNLTAAFEGTGFTIACGAFDDGWLTWGIIGFTLSSDLPKFLQYIESEYPGTLARAFGSNEPELRRILKAPKSEQQRWAESISVTKNKIANYGLRKDWEDGFAALGSYPEVQVLQIRVARSNYWDKLCVRDCKTYKAADVLDVAMLYETAVQNGGITRPELKGPFGQYVRNSPNATGKTRREQWAEMIANGSKPQWHNDVLKRRMMFAVGEGKVHGDAYRLSDWGLDTTRVDPEKLLAEHITFMPADFGSPAATKPKPPAGTLEAAVGAVAGTYDLAVNFMPAMALAVLKVGRPGIDTNWGPVAPIGLDDLLGQNNAALPADWRQWPDDRRATALVQLVGKAKGQYSSDIDGWWGQLVQWAFDQLVCLRTSKKPDTNWRDSDEPIDVNPHGWPTETKDQQALKAFYGQPGNVKLVKVKCPWPMHLTWDPSSKVTSISIHEKLGDSLTNILEAVHKHYGDAKLKELGLDRFSGSYNPRPMTGTDPPRPSLHSYGIAVDWDDDRNQYKWTRDKARMAKPEYRDWWQIWESEGWCSLGRVKDFDWMHVQAAKRT